MNRLAHETSPYLLQHKDNPVDWYPWGEEALARARSEDRPILLSIGYSACHWCHVMEHESFENPAIAGQMNERFVCIKVDREERPDLDHIYQGVAQALTRSGGWPLTVFLTPELKPYFGGTYFPPEDRYGRPGFPRVLDAIARAYREDPNGVAENAEKLTAFIRGMDQLPELAAGTGLTRTELVGLARQIEARVDPQFGGLMGAPKFPNPMIFSFLARMSWLEPGDRGLSEALHVTLERMASGGVFDQLGGGFHRYSVDATWSVPHFEKMLYDNGLLLRLYSEALCLGGPALTAERRELYLRAISMTVDYLLREMRSPEGAFYSTQDADSEGEEGRYFVWKPSELEALVQAGRLTSEQARALARRFGITGEGNFEHGATVLSLSAPIEGAEMERQVAEGARVLLEERAQRVAPATDRKILAGWNGLAISGLAWASQALRVHGREEVAGRALDAAAAAFDCVVTRMRQDSGAWMLCATLQEGVPKHEAYLDDYAFLAAAALDLSRFGSGDGARYLGQAREWCNAILVHFESEDGLGFYFTSENHEALIHRPKTVFDQAIPSGTAVALGAMAALGDLLEGGGERYAAEAASQLGRLGQLAARAPLGMGELLCAAALEAFGPVTVQGERARDLCRHPHVYRKPGEAPRGALICHRGTCLPPKESLEAAWGAVEAELRAE